MQKHIIAHSLVTCEVLELLGPHFARAFPVDETPCFGELLNAIDEADRALWRQRDRASANERLQVITQVG